MNTTVTIIRRFYTIEERPDPFVLSQLKAAEGMIFGEIEVRLPSHQHEALLSLAADLAGGLAFAKEGVFHNSRLVLAINAGMMQIAASEFFTFTYIRGRVDRRLWNKRNMESQLFLRGILPPLDK